MMHLNDYSNMLLTKWSVHLTSPSSSSSYASSSSSSSFSSLSLPLYRCLHSHSLCRVHRASAEQHKWSDRIRSSRDGKSHYRFGHCDSHVQHHLKQLLLSSFIVLCTTITRTVRSMASGVLIDILSNTLTGAQCVYECATRQALPFICVHCLSPPLHSSRKCTLVTYSRSGGNENVLDETKTPNSARKT